MTIVGTALSLIQVADLSVDASWFMNVRGYQEAKNQTVSSGGR